MREFSAGFESQLWQLCIQQAAELAAYLDDKICQSPIEADMATALSMTVDLLRNEPATILIPTVKRPQVKVPHFYIKPQVQIGRFRVDFVVGVSWGAVEAIVECDGREFHHSTREQIERDRARDKELEAIDYKVFRFPGTEIHNAPINCAIAVWDWVLEQNGGHPS